MESGETGKGQIWALYLSELGHLALPGFGLPGSCLQTWNWVTPLAFSVLWLTDGSLWTFAIIS